MSIQVKEVQTLQEMKAFLKLPFTLYRGCQYWVPELISIEKETFNPKKNPGYQDAETKLFIAMKDGEVVGRIVGLNSKIANRKYHSKNLRFGWFESIHDKRVSSALFEAAFAWARELDMETVTGPQGFTDLDKSGMLIEGFNELSTVAANYNHPYYVDLVEHSGFVKEIDYWEFFCAIPARNEIPLKLLRIAERVKKKSRAKLIKFTSRRHVMSRVREVFQLLNETFEELYGTVPLTDEQISYYSNKYIPLVDKDLIKVMVNSKDEVVDFMISMPNLSRAFRKSKGKLLPFGWYYILKDFKKGEVIDFYLAGVKKEYRGVGLDLVMVLESIRSARKKGFRYAESNPELETNKNIHVQWESYGPRLHKKRRVYKKVLT